MTAGIGKFRNKHAGEACLLVGNGPNLSLTPPGSFAFPAIGMNTCFELIGFWPNYYVTVDERLPREFRAKLDAALLGIPKFVPTPELDAWHGEEFYRFRLRPGPAWEIDEHGMTYGSAMHTAMLLAFYMGFTTMLMVGVDGEEGRGREHFWGRDDGAPDEPPLHLWNQGYHELVEMLGVYNVRVLNISPGTHVPASVLPRDDWRQYANQIPA